MARPTVPDVGGIVHEARGEVGAQGFGIEVEAGEGCDRTFADGGVFGLDENRERFEGGLSGAAEAGEGRQRRPRGEGPFRSRSKT